ncbi:MAG: hypothetical protein ABL966_06515, partial [Acidimicrobiales bacterium]
MSLRTRLVAATALVVVLALGGAAVATQSLFTRSLVNQVDVRLDQSAAEVSAVIDGNPDDPAAVIRQAAPGILVQLRDVDGTAILDIASGQVDQDDPETDPRDLVGSLDALAASATDQPDYATVAAPAGQDRFRVRTARLEDGQVLLVGATLHEA